MLKNGYDITSAREQGLEQAHDPVQFLHAATHKRVLLTHNETDFLLLHEAWLLWSNAWRVVPDHSGVIALPQREHWPAHRTVDEIEQILALAPALTNLLWLWKPLRGWHSFDLTIDQDGR